MSPSPHPYHFLSQRRSGEKDFPTPKMLSNFCPLTLRIPVDVEEDGTYYRYTLLHPRATSFSLDLDNCSPFSYTLEVTDCQNKLFSKSFITAQQHVINRMVLLGSKVFDNPEEVIYFEFAHDEMIVDFHGVIHGVTHGFDPPEPQVSSKPLWELCLNLNLLVPERAIKFKTMQRRKVEDVSSSVSRMERIKANFCRMVVMESALSVGLSGLVANYILEQDSSLSTALLTSSPYILKDIAKLHNWLNDLREYVLHDSVNSLSRSVTTLLTKKGITCFDVDFSCSVNVDTNLRLHSGIVTVLRALIKRVEYSNMGNFGSIWDSKKNDSFVGELDNSVVDSNTLMEELVEINCLGKILRIINLLISDPRFCYTSGLESIYDERLQHQKLVHSGVDHLTSTQQGLYVQKLAKTVEITVPISSGIAGNDDEHVYQALANMIFLPLNMLRSKRAEGHPVDVQDYVSHVSFEILMHTSIDCMLLSPFFDDSRSVETVCDELGQFGLIFSHACEISQAKTIMSMWKIDADKNPTFSDLSIATRSLHERFQLQRT